MMKPQCRGINRIQNRKNDANLLPLASSFCKNAIFVNIPNPLYSNRILAVYRFGIAIRSDRSQLKMDLVQFMQEEGGS